MNTPPNLYVCSLPPKKNFHVFYICCDDFLGFFLVSRVGRIDFLLYICTIVQDKY